jgi:short-subunit dehydrogenase
MKDAMTETGRQKTALITGASSGIGRELAELCARDGYDLVLVARRADRLRELEAKWTAQYAVRVRSVPMDLIDEDAPQRLFDELAGAPIDILVNNAGFGAYGPFAETEVATLVEMVRVNVLALTHLTRLFLPAMVQRGDGRILNLASMAAFEPGPLMAVYYATKAYVLSFSEALSEELRGSGITVTAFCPGPTATEFQSRAQLERSGLLRVAQADVGPIAEAGYRAMMQGKAVAVPGILNKIVTFLIRMGPRFLVRRVVHKLQSQVRSSAPPT